MKRLELFEFEDFPWLPKVIRSGVTNLIMVLHRLTGTADTISALILKAREKSGFDQIVDCGSGSGGAMLDVIEQVNASAGDKPVKLLLTDLHPNPAIVEAVNGQNRPHVQYRADALNAKHMDQAPPGLKTMVASFHHMPPEVAREILQSAEQNRQPILIYEIARNNIPTLLWWLLLPLSLLILIIMTLVMTPFVRPLTFPQLLFTYLIPIIPLVYAWDGQASLMRTYTFEDLESLLGERKDDYIWEIDDALKADGKKSGYFVLGYPT